MIGPIVILLAAPTSKSFLLERQVFRDSYQLFAQLAAEQNIDIRFVLGKKHYKDGVFDSYWKFEGPHFKHHREQFRAKLIFLQARFAGFTAEKRINNQFLEYVCRDKYKTAQFFGKYSKKTVCVTKKTRVTEFTTERIVVKPRFGTDGYKVSVMKKEDFDPEQFLANRFVVQECIDSSEGISGIIAQRHELRMYIFNGKLLEAYLRIPAEHSFLSNVSQGATEKQIDMGGLPKSVMTLIKDVDSVFTDITPRLYTIDIMFEGNRPWIVELNDMPGMPDVAVQPLTNRFLFALLEMFKNAVTREQTQSHQLLLYQ